MIGAVQAIVELHDVVSAQSPFGPTSSQQSFAKPYANVARSPPFSALRERPEIRLLKNGGRRATFLTVPAPWAILCPRDLRTTPTTGSSTSFRREQAGEITFLSTNSPHATVTQTLAGPSRRLPVGHSEATLRAMFRWSGIACWTGSSKGDLLTSILDCKIRPSARQGGQGGGRDRRCGIGRRLLPAYRGDPVPRTIRRRIDKMAIRTRRLTGHAGVIPGSPLVRSRCRLQPAVERRPIRAERQGHSEPWGCRVVLGPN